MIVDKAWEQSNIFYYNQENNFFPSQACSQGEEKEGSWEKASQNADTSSSGEAVT